MYFKSSLLCNINFVVVFEWLSCATRYVLDPNWTVYFIKYNLSSYTLNLLCVHGISIYYLPYSPECWGECSELILLINNFPLSKINLNFNIFAKTFFISFSNISFALYSISSSVVFNSVT